MTALAWRESRILVFLARLVVGCVLAVAALATAMLTAVIMKLSVENGATIAFVLTAPVVAFGSAFFLFRRRARSLPLAASNSLMQASAVASTERVAVPSSQSEVSRLEPNETGETLSDLHQSLTSVPRGEELTAQCFRIIDWMRASALTFLPIAAAVFLLLAVMSEKREHDIREWSFVAGLIVIGIFQGLLHFPGAVLDVGRNSLSFPTILWRRKIPIGDIQDANAQYIVRKIRLPDLWSTERSTVRYQTHSHRIYAVNLSGDFGARQLKFWSRKRRDQFLSILRAIHPQCRMTRWSSDYGDY